MWSLPTRNGSRSSRARAVRSICSSATAKPSRPRYSLPGRWTISCPIHRPRAAAHCQSQTRDGFNALLAGCTRHLGRWPLHHLIAKLCFHYQALCATAGDEQTRRMSSRMRSASRMSRSGISRRVFSPRSSSACFISVFSNVHGQRALGTGELDTPSSSGRAACGAAHRLPVQRRIQPDLHRHRDGRPRGLGAAGNRPGPRPAPSKRHTLVAGPPTRT